MGVRYEDHSYSGQLVVTDGAPVDYIANTEQAAKKLNQPMID